MKTAAFILLALLGLSSCVTIVEPYGPPGRDGRAYFGVDYDYQAPYGYWDNNPSIPVDPFLGEYYPTHYGLFDFEFYETEDDYWYGTYEVFINRGGPGLPHGEPGYDGANTYLMLVLGPRGPYEHRKAKQDESIEWITQSKTELEYVIEHNGGKAHVKMYRTNKAKRPSDKTLKKIF